MGGKYETKKLIGVCFTVNSNCLVIPEADVVDSKESSSYEMENGVEQEGETKQFDVGKHMFYVRYAHPDAYEDIGGSIEIPDGYEVFDIENVINCHEVTAAFDVWDQNTVPVEVTAVYNEEIEDYDYSRFGTPIELEKQKVYQKSQK